MAASAGPAKPHKQHSRPLYGFARKTTPSTPATANRRPKSAPFLVQEPSFTSGSFVLRQYDRKGTVTSAAMDLKTVRTDPWHYPNAQAVMEQDHFNDYRATSRNDDAAPKADRKADRERR